MNIAFIEDNKIIKKNINGDEEGLILFNLNNKLNIQWTNKTELYYKIKDKWMTYDYIKNNMEIIIIKHDFNIEFVIIDDILYSIEFENYCGKYKMINDILIIQWDIVKIYYEKTNEIYNILNTPEFFDCNYYLSQTGIYDISNYNDWNLAIEHYLLYGKEDNIKYCDKLKIIIKNKIVNCYINHTHNHILIDNKYYKYLERDNILKINQSPFIFNNGDIYYEKQINKNKTYIKNEFNIYEEINNNIINLKVDNIYIVGMHNNSGGSNKYINDLQNHYSNKQFNFIQNNEDLINYKNSDEWHNKNNLFIIQNLFFSDIELSTLLELIENIIIVIHDFYWLNTILSQNFDDLTYSWHTIYVNQNIIINTDVIKLFEKSKYIIHPSIFTYNIYNKYFNNKNFLLIPHNDEKVFYDRLNIFKVDTEINVGIFHKLVSYKGKELIEYLIQKYKTYKNYNIHFLITGINIEEYNEGTNFNELVKKYNIHCLPLLNTFGETYCYYLTKCIHTGIPILYNNIGSFEDRIDIVKKSYIKIDLTDIDYYFEKMLDYIILNNGKQCDNNKEYIYDDFYNNLFS